MFQVVIGAPTLQQRKAILSVLCARLPVCPTVDMAELAQRTSGYVGADLSALCREAAMSAIRENSKVNSPSNVLYRNKTPNILSLAKIVFFLSGYWKQETLILSLGFTARRILWGVFGNLTHINIFKRQKKQFEMCVL